MWIVASFQNMEKRARGLDLTFTENPLQNQNPSKPPSFTENPSKPPLVRGGFAPHKERLEIAFQ